MSIVKSRYDISLFDAIGFDDSGASPPVPGITDAVQFNGYGLQNATILTSQIIYSGASRAVSDRPYPRDNGAYVEQALWGKTTVTLIGRITGASQVAMEQTMDELRKQLSTKAGLLMFTWAGVQRVFTANADISGIFDKRRGSYTTYCPFEVTFTCYEPFGRATSRTVFQPPTDCTVAPTTYIVTNDGSAPTDSLWTFLMVTSGTCDSFTLTNVTTGESIVVAAAYGNGDTIVVDGENKIVYLNGDVQDYSGVFPSLNAGDNVLTLSPNGAGFDMTVAESHYPRYY